MAGRIYTARICLLLLIIVILASTAAGQDSVLDGHDPNRMALSIYVDKDGKSLATGYAEDINGLSFLKPSHYRYNNKYEPKR
ncbi:MAG: hypothetical protein ACE14P_11815 [Methanotrichaceae archaeon]